MPNNLENKTRIDHDRLSKELIETFFAEFMELFFPDIYPFKRGDGSAFGRQFTRLITQSKPDRDRVCRKYTSTNKIASCQNILYPIY